MLGSTETDDIIEECSYRMAYRCGDRTCQKVSVRHLENGKSLGWVKGCECHAGFSNIGWVPNGILQVVDERDSL